MDFDLAKTAAADADRLRDHIERVLSSKGQALLADLEDGPLSYAACRAQMAGFDEQFRWLGLSPGDRVLIVPGDDRATLALFLALLRAGLTAVMADASATPRECDELLAVTDPQAVFVGANHPWSRFDEAYPPAAGYAWRNTDATQTGNLPQGPGGFWNRRVAIGPRHPPSPQIALMVLTSGTTSAPKAVALSHGNLIAQMDIFRQVYHFDEDSRLFNILPLHHVDGLVRGPLTALWFGASLHRPCAFSVPAVPGILARIRRDGITHLITVPAMLRILDRVGRDQPYALRGPAFRFVLCSADLLDAALWQRFEAHFGTQVVNAYGLSEVVCDALFAGPVHLPDAPGRRIGTLGRPVGCLAAVVDEQGQPVGPGETGELVLAGPTVMHGYFADPDATARVLRAGRFHTGDLVRAGSDGVYEFMGRKKSAIVSGGFTIHPETATQVLASMPGVLDAYAFGVPDEAMGERLVVALVAAPGHVLTAEQALAYCRARLSPERSPRECHVLAQLPRGAAGKVVLSQLRALCSQAAVPPATPDVLSLAAACFKLAVEEVSLSSTPFDTPGWDSLAHMALIEALEQAYSVQFSAVQIAQMLSLEDAWRFVQENLATGSSSK